MKGLLLLLFLLVSMAGFSQPVISSFSPLKGPIGATVTITGTNFNTTPSSNIVFFGATKATVSIASATQLIVTVPQGATHEPITVTNIATSLTAYSKSPFLPTFTGSNNTVFSASSFASPVNLPTRALSYTIIVNDMNGDGKPDLAVLNTIGAIAANVNVYKNNSSTGTLSFDPKVDYSPGVYNPYDIAMADLDGDGKKDMTLLGDGSFVAYRNISTLSSIAFEEKGTFTTGARSHVIFSGDINGDGKPDIVTSSVFSNSVSVLINTTVGSNISFAPQMTLLVNNGYYAAFYLALADLDGDGKLDIITTDKDNNTLTVLRNTSSGGTASFAPKSFLAASAEPSTLAAHDIDGDGKPDLVYTSGNNLVVLRNVGTPGNIQFAAALTYTNVAGTNFDIFNIAFNDMDGDGNPDILLTNGNVLKNNSTPGNITMAAKVNFAGGGMAVEAGDLDGDGKPELILTNDNEVVTILRNTTPSFPVLTNVTISSGNANVRKAKTWDIVTATFTASEQISLPTVSIAGHVVTVTNTTGNTWSASYTMQAGDPEGNISLQIDYGGVGGAPVTATTDNSFVYFDRTAPAVITSNRSLPVATTTKAPLLIYRVAFSEPVTNVSAAAFQISPTGTASGTIMAVTNVSANQYDVTISGVSGNGSIRLDIKNSGSGIIDSTGNALTGGFTTGQLFTIDQSSKPTLNSLNLSSNNSFSNARAKVGDIVTASFNTSETIATPFVTITGHTTQVTNTSGNNWQAVYAMSSTDTEGALGVIVAFTDVTASTIAGIPVATTTDGSAVIFDKTAPAVTAVNRLTPLSATAINNATVVYRVQFNEPVTGITTNSFQLFTTGSTTATIAAVSAFSASSFVDVTINVSNSVGTLRLDLKNAGTGITDNAGNPMTAGYSGGQVYTIDQVTQPPVLTSPVVSSTNYVGFWLAGSMPENYLPGSAKLFFDDGTTVKTMTLVNNITSPFGFSVPLGGVAPQIASATALGTYGIYTVTFSYQDVLGNPSASTSVQNVKIKLQQAAETNSAFVTDITKNSATIKGEIDGSGFETTVRFIYGTDPSLQDASTVRISNPVTTPGLASGVFSVTANMTGLEGGTVYYYQISANNFLGYGNSPIYSFSTIASIGISSMSPQSGPAGREITISGNGFNTVAGDNIVYFGAVKGTVVSATKTQLKVIVPVGASYQPISVVNKATKLTAYTSKPFTLTYETIKNWNKFEIGTAGLVYSGLKSFAIADLNADGIADIAASTREEFAVDISEAPVPTGTPQLFVKGGPFGRVSSGFFDTTTVPSMATQRWPAEAGIGEVIAKDLDGDGWPDLIAANKLANSISITKNNGNGGPVTVGSFGAKFDIPTSGTVTSIATADLDLDGRPEIIAICGNKISIFKNQYNGTTLGASSFAIVAEFTGISSNTHVEAGDIDGDGKPDLVVTNGTNISIYRNISNGDFSFAARVDFPVGYESFALAIGDLDLDGKADIAVTTYNSNNLLSIFKNNASPGVINTSSLAAKVDINSGTSSELTSIAIGDLDGDGRPDIVTSDWNRFAPKTRIFPNTTQTGTINSNSFDQVDGYYIQSPVKVAIQDMDNDGRADIVAIGDFGTALYYQQHYTPLVIIQNKMTFTPLLSKFSPATASLGDTVMITGRDFTNANAVQFGGKQAKSYTVLSDTTIRAIVNDGSSGSVTVNTQDGPVSLAGFTWISRVPVINSFIPAAAAKGETVIIKGINFTGATVVRFGNTPARSFIIDSSTQIRAVIDTGSSGAISVVTTKGTGTLTGFSYIMPVIQVSSPVITSFSPATGMAGSLIAIRGTGFTGATKVQFGNIDARSFTIDSAGQIKAVVDTGATGSIRVITPGGTSTLSGFSYIATSDIATPAPLTPVITPTATTIISFSPSAAVAGTTVIITGTNFTDVTNVRFGDVAASSFTVDSSTQIKAVVGSGASGSVYITAGGKTLSLSGFSFISPPPTVISFSPVTATSGTMIIIKGSGFTNATNVRFGDIAAASFTIDADGQIRAIVGSGATGSIYVTTAQGTGSLAGFNFIPSTPIISADGPLTICEGLSVKLTSSINGFDNQWYKDGLLIAGNKSNTLKVTLPGIYTVTAGNNGFISNASAGTTVTVITAPIIAKPTINGYTKDTLVCFTDVLILTVNGTYDKYLWSTGETTKTIFVNKERVLTVQVGSNNATCLSIDSSIAIDARKNITPVPLITRTSLSELTSSIADNYRWLLNNVFITGITTGTLPMVSKGVYNVSTSKDKVCWSISPDYFILLDPVVVKKAFELVSYPNPSPNGSFNIQIKFEKAVSAAVIITITDQAGVVKLSTKKILFSDKVMKIPVNLGLAKGTYSVKVEVNGEINTQQIIVQ